MRKNSVTILGIILAVNFGHSCASRKLRSHATRCERGSQASCESAAVYQWRLAPNERPLFTLQDRCSSGSMQACKFLKEIERDNPSEFAKFNRALEEREAEIAMQEAKAAKAAAAKQAAIEEAERRDASEYEERVKTCTDSPDPAICLKSAETYASLGDIWRASSFSRQACVKGAQSGCVLLQEFNRQIAMEEQKELIREQERTRQRERSEDLERADEVRRQEQVAQERRERAEMWRRVGDSFKQNKTTTRCQKNSWNNEVVCETTGP